ncbi:MAG TPA: 7-cyano-7-deazaguanine synthase [Gemmataceae bacterium]|jgi:7-cyano-7-deazaguanine synthase in queuosine biosynthesis|nr:7-cyano-7-deazaguanine synthase [Gemmataceae bacterium]
MLLLWSGGCDSTLMLFWFARQAVANGDPAPRTLAINYEQVPCAEQQRKARGAILKELAHRKLPVQHAELTLTKETEAAIECEQGANADGSRTGLVQPALWLSLAQPFLQPTENLYLGYVRGDDIWHYRTQLFDAFNAMQGVLKKTGTLQLPYEWWPKCSVISELRAADLLKHVWYCEDRTVKKPCGSCPACRTMSAGLHLESTNAKEDAWRKENETVREVKGRPPKRRKSKTK